MVAVIIAVFASIASVAISMAVGFGSNSRPKDRLDYQIADRTVSATAYATASIGYALQMAAVFLFAYWGLLFGLGALWTVLFWFGGFWLLYGLLPRFLPYLDSNESLTLHEYLGKTFGRSRALQLLAAAATILGLLGTLMAEVDYTILIFDPVVIYFHGSITSSSFTILIELVFLLGGLSYILYNGYKAEVNTEQWQVPVAYGGLLLVLVGTLPAVWLHSGSSAFAGIAIAFIVILALLFSANRPFRQTLFPLKWQTVIPLITCLAVLAMWTFLKARVPHGPTRGLFTKPLLEQLRAQGILGVLSLFFANVLWMPVDLSTWQRIESIDRSGGSEKTLERLRQGTWRVMIESPASWCLGVLLGWIIRAAGVLDPGQGAEAGLGAFASSLARGRLLGVGSIGGPLLYFFFVASCVAVMLSTISSLFAAISYTADRDLLRRQDGSSLTRLRYVSTGILLLGFMGYTLLRRLAGASLAALLYGAYSVQLALIVVVVLMLFKTRLSTRGAIGSVCIGFLGTAASTYLAIRIPDDRDARFSVLPPLCAIIGAVAGYVLFYRRDISESKLSQ